MRQRLIDSDLRDLLAPDLLADPYPAYESLRGSPIRLRSGTAVVTGHADSMAVLRGEAFVRESMPPIPGRSFRTISGILINQNPPEHTRLRRPVTPLLPPAAIDRVEHTAAAIADRALAAASLDVVSGLAFPLAATVIGELLGIPAPERPRAGRWSLRLTQAVDSPVPLRALRLWDVLGIMQHQRTGAPTVVALVRAVRAAERALNSEHGEEAALVRSLQASVAAGTLTEREAASMWLQLLLAGVDTVQSMLASTVWLLATHPEQFEQLVADPTLAPGAIEEALRFESPTRLMGRIVGAHVELSGQPMAAGDDIVAIIGAANRDPDVFHDPNRFDITRARATKHVAFGHGVHFCVGAAVARAEVTGALRALTERFRTPPSVNDAAWRPSYFMRSLARLEIQLDS